MNNESGQPVSYSIHHIDGEMVAFFFDYIPGLKSLSVKEREILVHCEGAREGFTGRIAGIPEQVLEKIKKTGCYVFATDPVRVCFEEKLKAEQFA